MTVISETACKTASMNSSTNYHAILNRIIKTRSSNVMFVMGLAGCLMIFMITRSYTKMNVISILNNTKGGNIHNTTIYSHDDHHDNMESLSQLFYDWNEQLPADLSRWDQCDIPTLCPPKSTVSSSLTNVTVTPPKTLWLSGYPVSGDDLLTPKLINTIFQQFAAGKNYYKKKCKSQPNTITATCSQIHPIVALSPHPKDRTDQFASSVIMLLRNPMNAAPAHWNDKANKYHNIIGQVDIDSWLSFRSAYIMPNIENKNITFIYNWINYIEEWKNNSGPYYNISLYVPYESMFSFNYGPKIIQQLVKIFEYENFTIPIVVDNDNNKKESISCLQCIWYQSVTKESLLKYYNVTMNKFEFYETYMPSYTKQHHDYTIQELRNYANKYQTSDKTLYDIIQQYIYDIEHYTSLDDD